MTQPRGVNLPEFGLGFWVVDPKFSEDLLRRSFPEEFCPQAEGFGGPGVS